MFRMSSRDKGRGRLPMNRRHNSMSSRFRSVSPPLQPPLPRMQRKRKPISPNYSSYYRDRFGSHSPEEYKNLRLTNIDPKVSNDELREILEKYFQTFGEMNVKVVRHMELNERLAYVNFENPRDAKEAKRRCLANLYGVLGRHLKVDPAGVIRDQDGRFVMRATSRRSSSPFQFSTDSGRYSRNQNDRDRIDNGGGGGGGGYGRYKEYDSFRPPSRHQSGEFEWNYPKRRRLSSECSADSNSVDEANSTRTLFVGNLEYDVTLAELKRIFSKFGVIEQVDIKTPNEGPAYAFIRYQNLAMAREAKRSMNGHYVRNLRCKVGYGKPLQSRRLWIGGLGPNTSLAWLEKEFDRFGAIEKIDFIRGDNHAYVLFASTEAAIEGWKKMKGTRIKDGSEFRLLQVDFADSSMYDHRQNFADFDSRSRPHRRRSLVRGALNRRMSPSRGKISPMQGNSPSYVNSFGDGNSPSFRGSPATARNSPARRDSHTHRNSPVLTSKQSVSSEEAAFEKKQHRRNRTRSSSRSRSKTGSKVIEEPLSVRNDVKVEDISQVPLVCADSSRSTSPVNSVNAENDNVTREKPLESSFSAVTPPSSGASPSQSPSADDFSRPSVTALNMLHASSLEELNNLCSPCWVGAMILKKSCYPVRCFKLYGDDDLIDAYLRDEQGDSVHLTINQRLKLDQPKADDMQKWLSSSDYAFMLAAANTNVLSDNTKVADEHHTRNLKMLVRYFKDKNAAGVVTVTPNRRAAKVQQNEPSSSSATLSAGVLYAFPQCAFTRQLLALLCPKVTVLEQCHEEALLIVLQKNIL